MFFLTAPFFPPIDNIKAGYCTVTCWFVKSCSEALRWHFQCCHLSVLKLDVTNEAWMWLWKHTLMDTSWIMLFSASYNDQRFQNWLNVGFSITKWVFQYFADFCRVKRTFQKCKIKTIQHVVWIKSYIVCSIRLFNCCSQSCLSAVLG